MIKQLWRYSGRDGHYELTTVKRFALFGDDRAVAEGLLAGNGRDLHQIVRQQPGKEGDAALKEDVFHRILCVTYRNVLRYILGSTFLATESEIGRHYSVVDAGGG